MKIYYPLLAAILLLSNKAMSQPGSNVGVGTKTPTAKLDINGDLRIRTIPAGDNTSKMLTADANGNIKQSTITLGGLVEMQQFSTGDFPNIKTTYTVTDWVAGILGSDYTINNSANLGNTTGMAIYVEASSDGFWHIRGDLKGVNETWNRIQLIFVKRTIAQTIANGSVTYGQ
ncbi:MAG TPA: hypothetical protein VM802_03640 [Chitinophaga sp.]|uniref:hypothetical protein n=1 Tax=Chitinophaga sp. TaxID=1869181 RepID=UPI002D104FA0|nr:hypothetical protein [Chitinophaga sp.]HVI43927.1 hypothetical protein [Chitinophaga sp.]